LLETRPGQQHFGATAHVEGEVFAAFHVRRGLDHEQAMVIIGACRAHERPGANEGVGGAKAQPLGVKSFSFRRIGYEIHHVGQSARNSAHIESNARLVERPLWRMAGGVGQVIRCTVRLAHADLKSDGETHVVNAVQHAVLITTDTTITGQLIFDGIQIADRSDPVDRLANRRRRADCRRQIRIVGSTDNHGGTVQRFETSALAVNADRCKAVVAQAIGAGLNVIDAKNQGIKANDVHGLPLH
jgi:hypothetical protein